MFFFVTCSRDSDHSIFFLNYVYFVGLVYKYSFSLLTRVHLVVSTMLVMALPGERLVLQSFVLLLLDSTP